MGEKQQKDTKHDVDVRGVKRSSFLRNISLVYSIFFLIDPWQRHSMSAWITFGIAYSLFLALFLSVPYAKRSWKPALYLAFFALCFAYVPHNQGAAGMFVYPMALLVFDLQRPRDFYTTLTIYVAAIISEGLSLGLSPWSFALGSFFTIVVALSNWHYVRQAEVNARLNLAQSEIEHLAKTAERERIARDLHDVLGHTLTLVVLKAQVANQLIDSNPAQAAREVADIETTARKALAEVREAVLGMRFDGLTAEINRAGETLASAGIAFNPSLPDGLVTRLKREQEQALALAVREAVTNVVRHARARRCSVAVTLSEVSGHLSCTVQDDGCGRRYDGGQGLRGMRERIEALAGTMSLVSDNGTRLEIELPLTQRSEAVNA